MILAFVDDLFFRTKIETVAHQINVEVRFTDKIYDNADLIIVDLNNEKTDVLELVRKMRKKNIKVIGFLSHVQRELAENAREVGCIVMPRSEFSRMLKEILKGEYPIS